jgi:hypothetical protein
MHRTHPRHAGRTLQLVQLAASLITAVGLCVGLAAMSAGASTASQKAAAKRTLLAVADMPKGWTREKGSVSGESGYPGTSQLTNCIGDTSKLITNQPPEVDSPFFQNKAETQEVQDSVAIFSSAAVARAEFDAIANAKTPGCEAIYANGSYKTKLEASTGSGTKVGTITVSARVPGYFGRDTSSFTMSVPVTSQGTTFAVRITSVYFIKGDFGQQITMNSYGTTPDVALLKHLTAVAQHRL